MSDSNTSNDSLDLLLDTICNTFGGVLFISLLVVILLNMSSESVTVQPPSAAQQTALQTQQAALEERNTRIETLQKAVQRQQLTRERFADPDAEELVQRQQRLASEQADLVSRRNRHAESASQTQSEINQTATQMQAVSEAIAAARQQLADLETQLAREVAVRSRAAKLPKQHETAKTEVPFLLKESSLCAFAKSQPGSGTLERNETECEILTDARGTYANPKVQNGLRVNADGSNAAAITAKLSTFDKDKFYITVAVWPDSYAACQVVKDAIVAEGYEYRLLPLPAEQHVYVGGGPAGPASVQ